MHRRGIERQPARIALGGVVAVLVAVADRRKRPPELVMGLRVGALDALHSAEFLDFVVVARIDTARERRRWAGAELASGLHSPRPRRRILREKRRRSRDPDAGPRQGAVRVRDTGVVVLAIGEDAGRDFFAQGNAGGPRGTIRHALQHRPEGGIDARFLAWILPHRSEEHTSELQSRFDLVCRLLLEQKDVRMDACYSPAKKTTSSYLPSVLA